MVVSQIDGGSEGGRRWNLSVACWGKGTGQVSHWFGNNGVHWVLLAVLCLALAMALDRAAWFTWIER